jgi:hypothetical protein
MGTDEQVNHKIGGASRDRTGDLLHAMQALSQLSYGPMLHKARYFTVRGLQGQAVAATKKPLASGLIW